MFLSLVLVFCAASYAAALDLLPKDEQKLAKLVTDLDKEAALPDGPGKVGSKLMDQFKVDDARIQGLRGQKLGYGEVSIVLALAEKLPGGISDVNVDSIMALRKGPPVMGWGQIAKKQGVKLGQVLSKVKKVEAAAKWQGKAEAEEMENMGKKAEKAEESARPEKPERMDRPERPERPAKPEHSKH
ncbi:MAG: hypothetical protein A2X36_16590 [Elusimicrobia bacterium GWA2_69_24]|nr:MAG: hypothetical protein A2X36_16590 [Elusimicrobia bacterium GWA2_69_24]HBL17064.1 hypothetical protein [Elusimicrobiota bacterium]